LQLCFLFGLLCLSLTLFHCFLLLCARRSTFEWLMQRRGSLTSPENSGRARILDSLEAKRQRERDEFQRQMMLRAMVSATTRTITADLY
jgi:hypothetical protein